MKFNSRSSFHHQEYIWHYIYFISCLYLSNMKCSTLWSWWFILHTSTPSFFSWFRTIWCNVPKIIVVVILYSFKTSVRDVPIVSTFVAFILVLHKGFGLAILNLAPLFILFLLKILIVSFSYTSFMFPLVTCGFDSILVSFFQSFLNFHAFVIAITKVADSPKFNL